MRLDRTLVFILFSHLKNLGKMKIHIWWFSYKGVLISLTWVIPWSFMYERKKQVTYMSSDFNAWVPHGSILGPVSFGAIKWYPHIFTELWSPCPHMADHLAPVHADTNFQWYIIFQQKSDSKYTSLLTHPLYKYQESPKIKYLLTTSIQDENGNQYFRISYRNRKK